MEKEEISMRKLHRAVALLLTLMMVLSVLPLGAAALTVPDDQELIYFADCGADTFPSEIQTMIEHSTTVKNAEKPAPLRERADLVILRAGRRPWGRSRQRRGG